MQLCMHTCRHDMHTPLQTLSKLTARYEIHVNSISHEARARKRTPRASKMYLQVYLQVYLQSHLRWGVQPCMNTEQTHVQNRVKL